MHGCYFYSHYIIYGFLWSSNKLHLNLGFKNRYKWWFGISGIWEQDTLPWLRKVEVCTCYLWQHSNRLAFDLHLWHGFMGKNNDRLTNSGNIVVKQGTALDSTHIVYQLSTGAPSEYQLYWKVTNDILFVLDENLTPRVGDARSRLCFKQNTKTEWSSFGMA